MKGEKEKKFFVYSGGVMKYDRVVADKWFCRTMATTEKKAKSNIAFQFKKKMGYSHSVPIKLIGKVQVEN